MNSLHKPAGKSIPLLLIVISIIFLLSSCGDNLGLLLQRSQPDTSNPMFVAVGGGGRIMTSTDGAVWNDETEAGDYFLGISYGN